MKTLLALILSVFLFQQNQPPVVKITLPKSGETVEAGAQLRYSIHVSDKEDGDTKYDEINTNEILLSVSANGGKPNDKSGLLAMMSSNCMNCHAFNSKLIGPSFLDISVKRNNIAELVKHVKEGSSKVWGDIVMPSHPELNEDEIGKMVNWISKFKNDQNTSYYLGKEGSVRLPAAIGVTLTASYLDHQQLLGEDNIVLKIK